LTGEFFSLASVLLTLFYPIYVYASRFCVFLRPFLHTVLTRRGFLRPVSVLLVSFSLVLHSFGCLSVDFCSAVLTEKGLQGVSLRIYNAVCFCLIYTESMFCSERPV
jgi:hypothetical protein